MAVNEFLQKRDLLYNFVQKEESTLVKFEPLIQSAIQKMGLTFNPQQKVRDTLYVDKDNIYSEFDRIVKKVLEKNLSIEKRKYLNILEIKKKELS